MSATKVSKVWLSQVQYRPDPAEGQKGVIPLGLLIEFNTPKYWAVGCMVRAGLDQAKLAGLDELTRNILEHRGDVIARELEQVLPKAKKPGDALTLLSANNRWSIYVSRPQTLDVPASVFRAEKTPDQIMIQFIGYIRRLQQEPAGKASGRAKATSAKAPKAERVQMPRMFSPNTVVLEMRA